MSRIPLAACLLTVTTNLAFGQAGLIVSGYNNDALLRFDETTFVATGGIGGVGGAPGAQSVHYGPDGHVYACAEKVNRVVRIDGQTGAFLSVFVGDDPSTPTDETGGLDAPTAAVFGRDGNLYVAAFNGDNVLRYDGQTGAFLGVFVGDDPSTPVDESGGLNGPDAGMVFGPDGHLYVPSFNNNRVLRYDGETGEFLGTFIAPFTGGLQRPRVLRFHVDGRLWVTSWSSNRILRFDMDGGLIDIFATPQLPTGLVFRPDTGNLLVTSDNVNAVLQYDVITKAFLGAVIPGTAGINGGTYLEYFPDRQLRHQRLAPGTAGGVSQIGVTGAAPFAPLLLLFGTSSAPAYVGACHTWIGVKDPGIVPLTADASGSVTLSPSLPPTLAGVKLVTQFFEPGACRSSNLGVTMIQ